MASRYIESFLQKSWSERYRTGRFYFRQGLAKIPFLPTPVRLQISPTEDVVFWWSRVVPYFHENRNFFDYWGQDAGDLRFLCKMLQPGMVFMDIGAFRGVYSLVAAKRLRGNGLVIASEPSPRDYNRLCMHLRLNRIFAARAELLALGAQSARSTFFQVVSGDTTRNGLRPPASSDPIAEISVQTISLDQYVAHHQVERVDVIKLDVEGGEIDVLRGAADVFIRLRPVLICEVLDAATQVWGYDARDIISVVQAYDYEWFDCREDGSLVRHESRDSYAQVKNYFAIPREKCHLYAQKGRQ